MSMTRKVINTLVKTLVKTSINITFNQLNYNDRFDFLCVGESRETGYVNLKAKNASLVIQDILGKHLLW